MAFEPSILEFHRSDVDKLVKYKERIDAMPDWNVTAVRYGSSRLNAARWTFPPSTVMQDPTSGSREQGTLHFDSTGLSTSVDAGDVLLRTLWAQSTSHDITIDINCTQSNQSHTLTVRLMP